MSEVNPWDLAYELNKEYYSRADIDDMLFCEVEELINQENLRGNERRCKN